VGRVAAFGFALFIQGIPDEISLDKKEGCLGSQLPRNSRTFLDLSKSWKGCLPLASIQFQDRTRHDGSSNRM